MFILFYGVKPASIVEQNHEKSHHIYFSLCKSGKTMPEEILGERSLADIFLLLIKTFKIEA